MSEVRRIATVHADGEVGVWDEVLGHIEQALVAAGASRIWIDPAIDSGLVVMAELPARLPG